MIGDKLKYLREKKGLSQSQLARQFSVTTRTIQSYEQNISKPKIDILKSFSKFYNVPVDFILEHNVSNETLIESLPMSNTEKQLLNYYCSLNETERNAIFHFVKIILQ